MTLMDAGCQDVLDKWKPRSFCTVMQVISLCLSIAIDGHVSQLRLGFSFCSNSMPSKCSAKNCNSKSGDRGVSLLRFPVDDVRRALWLQHCPHNFVPKKSSVLCTLHFGPMKYTPRKRSHHQLNSLQDPIPVSTEDIGTVN
jgi:hypothetical protein